MNKDIENKYILEMEKMYKKDKEIFIEKYKNTILDVLNENFSCPICGDTVWIRKRIQKINEEWRKYE